MTGGGDADRATLPEQREDHLCAGVCLSSAGWSLNCQHRVRKPGREPHCGLRPRLARHAKRSTGVSYGHWRQGREEPSGCLVAS